MSEPKFTPGPWLTRKVDNQEWEIDVRSSGLHDGAPWDGLVVVYGCEHKPSEGEEIARANASLIAAAPDLYAAACSALSDFERIERTVPKSNFQASIIELRAALKRASGE